MKTNTYQDKTIIETTRCRQTEKYVSGYPQTMQLHSEFVKIISILGKLILCEPIPRNDLTNIIERRGPFFFVRVFV